MHSLTTKDRFFPKTRENEDLHLLTVFDLDPNWSSVLTDTSPRPPTIPKYGFGMSDLSETMRRRFDSAVEIISLFLENEISPDEIQLDAVSELKGMFNRSLRKDQWNWFTVYDRLGYPPQRDMRFIVSRLVQLRKNLKEDEYEQALSIRSELVNSTLPTWLNNWKDCTRETTTEDEIGWLYVLSRRDEPDIVKIGMTTRSVAKRVKEINSATGVLRPYSVRSAYKVECVRNAEKIVFKRLADYRIREDREFFQIPFEKACKLIESEIFHFLTRRQGELKWFDASRGFGFIKCIDHESQDVFVHISQIVGVEADSMRIGQKMKFDIDATGKGLSAINVVLVCE